MFIRKQKRKDGRVYLSVVQGYRDENGKSKSKHVRSLGYLDELEKLYDDPIAHFKPRWRPRTRPRRRRQRPSR